MRLNKLVYDVREAIKDFSDDSELDNRYIIYLYNIKRAKYLRQSANKSQTTIDITNQQTLCLDTKLVNANDCGLDIDCKKLLRTTVKVPKILELRSKSAVSRIAPSNKLSKPFNFITREKAIFTSGAPFKTTIYSFLHSDGYIYLIGNTDAVNLIECISITAVFEDPTELSMFKNCCNCPTATIVYNELTSDYPLQAHIIDIIRTEIINELGKLKQITEDKDNNADDK